ncbi:MAG: prepilin-type N-terminal cleavage/methylation domain-containing protein [candidate division NC10 bacterium]|nr:prepilin-type N-terminal cleavage/methylation domain-containing protein [candidate division NC10 bacterium]
MSEPHARAGPYAAGLTLVEVLVGLLILTVGLLAISAMVPTAYSNFSSSGSDTLALAFAQQRLDQLRALPYNDSSLSAGTYTDSGGNAPGDSNYTRSYQVEVDTPVAGVKRLTVTATGPRSRQVQLKTLITQ